MLQDLLEATTHGAMTNLGVKLATEAGGMRSLQEDLRKAHLVFNSDNLWTDDVLSLSSTEVLIGKTQNDTESDKVLHLLQVLQQCCPAVESSVRKMLSRMMA